MIPQLGQVTVTLQRFGPSVFDGSRWTVPTPTETEIAISVDPSPKRTRSTDTDGNRSRVDLVAVSYSEIRTASDRDGWSADRIVLDGRTYEVLYTHRSPPFAGVQPESWYIEATEIQPLVVGSTAPIAPVNVTIPTIQGERGVGDTVSFTPGTWTRTQPIAFTYSVLLDGVEVSISTTWTDTAETIDQTLQVVVTATNAASPSGVEAESQPLGNGSGPVDCEVTCADTIAAAVAAAVAPLEAEIVQLEIDLAEAIADRDALQALYDAALITIAERDATIVILNATIATLQAAILRSKGWRNYGLDTPTASANATRNTGTGVITLTHPGDAGADPGDAITYMTWPLVWADGTAASGYPRGPFWLEYLSAFPTGDVFVCITDSPTIEAAGSYALYSGKNSAAGRILTGARIAGAAWSRTAGAATSQSTGPTEMTLSHGVIFGTPGALRQTVVNLEAGGVSPTTNAGQLTSPTVAWGTAPVAYLHVGVLGAAATVQVRPWASPACVLGATP